MSDTTTRLLEMARADVKARIERTLHALADDLEALRRLEAGGHEGVVERVERTHEQQKLTHTPPPSATAPTPRP